MKKIDVKFRNPYNNCILSKIIFHQYLPKFIRTFDLMGSQTDRFRYEVFQNLILRPMNTGLLRPAVATVPTVYGIETMNMELTIPQIIKLQQYLPFTVLKLHYLYLDLYYKIHLTVATVPTVYGIETLKNLIFLLNLIRVATVPTVYGIEIIRCHLLLIPHRH